MRLWREGSMEKLKEIVADEGAKKSLYFLTGIEAAGLLKLLTDELDQTDAQYSVFTDCKPEPSYRQVEEVVEMVQGYESDLIIGIGGALLWMPPSWQECLRVHLIRSKIFWQIRRRRRKS